MKRRVLLGVIVVAVVALVATVQAKRPTHPTAPDWISTAGWLRVGDDRVPALYLLVDCNGPCPDDPLPDGAIRAAGRAGDADARVSAWLVRHDGRRIRVTWSVESPAGKDQ